MEERLFHVLMREACTELGVKMEELSYGWILQLSKEGKIRHVTGTRFDLNPEASGNIACDKYATYEVLNSQNIPVIKHTMIFNPDTRSYLIDEEGTLLTVMLEFLKHGSLVVKPNNGRKGQGVILCRTLNETESAIHKLFKTQHSVSICPYYDIHTEYRAFYLDGQVHLIYGKTKPYVIGNGSDTFGELIRALNLQDKDVVQDSIKKFNLDYIPSVGEKVNISWKHNISCGAKPVVLDKGDLYDKIEKLAISAAKALNINFATVDIIETNDGEFFVLEINSEIGDTILPETIEGGSDIIKEIYKKAITKLFE